MGTRTKRRPNGLYVHDVVKGPDVISTVLAVSEHWKVPAGVLTDIGAVCNAISRALRRLAQWKWTPQPRISRAFNST